MARASGPGIVGVVRNDDEQIGPGLQAPRVDDVVLHGELAQDLARAGHPRAEGLDAPPGIVGVVDPGGDHGRLHPG